MEVEQTADPCVRIYDCGMPEFAVAAANVEPSQTCKLHQTTHSITIVTAGVASVAWEVSKR